MSKKWTMPQWMEQYRESFNNTGGNTIEELMNNHKVTIFENAQLAMICVAVKSQVKFLETIRGRDYLIDMLG